MSKLPNIISIICNSGINGHIPKFLFNYSDTYTPPDNNEKLLAGITLVKNNLSLLKSSQNGHIEKLLTHILRKFYEKF